MILAIGGSSILAYPTIQNDNARNVPTKSTENHFLEYNFVLQSS